MIRRILSIAALMLASLAASAQSASFVNLADNARRMALGGADAAYSVSKILDDSFKGSADATYVMWQPQALGNNIVMLDGYFKVADKFALSAGGKFNMYKPYESVNQQGNPAGSFTPSEMMGFLGFHYGVNDNLALVADIKFVSSKLAAKYAGQAIGADLGLAYDIDGLMLAFTARNVGTKITYSTSVQSNLPMTVLLGAEKSIDMGDNALDFAVDAGYMPLHSCMVAKAGAEFSIQRIFDIRAGFHFGSNKAVEPSYATVGIGANVNVVRLGFAYFIAGGDSPLKNTLAFSVGAQF
ncbi:MAG: PorV/PorQ family protein [Bacteroidales bacterium]|nr:PorV/PorQ family protein [Bacteroidales bacterium]